MDRFTRVIDLSPSFSGEQVSHLSAVCRGQRDRTPESPLPPRRLLAEHVTGKRVARAQLPARCGTKPLLRPRMRLHLRHDRGIQAEARFRPALPARGASRTAILVVAGGA